MVQRQDRLPFAAGVLVVDKVLAVLVDGVVGEMHADVILAEKTEEERSAVIQATPA